MRNQFTGANAGSAFGLMISPSLLCLSVRQPWAWLIVNDWKNVENREWPTRVRGRILIHASGGMTRREYDACRIFMAGFTDIQLPLMHLLERGGIVGETNLLDCVTQHHSEWFCGPYGFVLADSKPLPFEPRKGALGFFKVERHNQAQRPGHRDVGQT